MAKKRETTSVQVRHGENIQEYVIDLEKIRESEHPGSCYFVFAVDMEDRTGMAELHASPMSLASMLISVFDAHGVDEDKIFALIKMSRATDKMENMGIDFNAMGNND